MSCWCLDERPRSTAPASGAWLNAGNDSAQIARALVAIAGIGTAFQDVIAADRGVEALLRGIEHPSSDVTAVAAAALGNLTANNNKIKRRVRSCSGPPTLAALMHCCRWLPGGI